MKLKKGDEVIITSGKDKGKKGKIEKVLGKKDAVLLPGLNVFKRHLKKRDEKNPGGIVEFNRPIPVGKVSLVCPKCGKTVKIGYKITEGKKSRFCRKCKAIL